MKELAPKSWLAAACGLAVLLVVAAGCGGGGGGGDEQPPPPPPTLLITTTTLPDGVVGTAYNQTVAATGGTGARTFSISAGSLPAGLALNASTGVISGTPTGPAGTASFTVQVVDTGTPQQTDTQALTIDINDPLVITTMVLPSSTIGVAYNATVLATGGSGALTFTISNGSLPAGLSMNAAGVISGTPTAAATSQNFTVRVADGSSPQQVDTQVTTIFVALEITTTSLPSGIVGVGYSQTVVARGGRPPYSWAVTVGVLPAGLGPINTSTGAITGTPTTPETQAFTVQAEDFDGFTDTQGLSITIAAALNITTGALPNATIGVAYNQTLVNTGGNGPFTWSITLGSLPAGLAMSAAGVISGTPTAGATSQTFTVQVADSSAPQQTDTQVLTILVTLEITTTILPSGNIGVAYSQTVTARGGRTPYTWAVTVGNLPAGLAINSSTGVISGTPTTQETQAFTVQVTDANAQTDTQGLSITIGQNLDRNDTIPTATPLSNGTFAASISPSGDPNTVLAPDQDFYQITATGGAIVTVNINAQVNGSPLDSVIEIVDVNGVRLSVCSISTGPPYNQPCVSDDEVLGVQLDSFLEMQVGATTTFFVHVVDFRGDARPDLLYDIVISGAN